MDESDGNRSLANGGGHALDAAAANIADGEHAGEAGFEKMRRTAERPSRRAEILAGKGGARFDESLRVKCETSVEPTCTRQRAGHEENMPDRSSRELSGSVIAPTYTLEMTVPFKSDQLCLCLQVDSRIVFNATNKVSRHTLRQSARPHEYLYTFGSLRKKDGSLSGGVSAADHDYLFTNAQ